MFQKVRLITITMQYWISNVKGINLCNSMNLWKMLIPGNVSFCYV